jgi:hypothetical protein
VVNREQVQSNCDYAYQNGQQSIFSAKIHPGLTSLGYLNNRVGYKDFSKYGVNAPKYGMGLEMAPATPGHVR